MRKKSTRLLSAALAVCMTVTVLPMSAFASGEEELKSDVSPQKTTAEQSEETGGVTGDVVINEAFPDQVFREFVKQYDNNNDGKLSQDELAAVTEMDLDPYDVPYDKPYRGEKISSLKGIEHFTSLKNLNCKLNLLTELDVSKNPALESLDCSYNQLRALDVSNNLALKELNCCGSNNGSYKLSALDVSQNKALEGLICRRNQLSALDLSNNQKLSAHLYCDSNQLTSLNLGERYFEFFSCNGNSYDIVVDETNCYDLSKLPGKFDASKVMDLHGGTLDKENNILTVDKNATEITYTYNCGTYINSGNIIKAKCKLNVTHHTHHYGDWLHDEAYHWHECTDHDCPEPEESVKDKAEHTFDDNAKDKDCNTCGYVRPLYTVTTDNAAAKLESEAEELKAPVAAGTKVHLTATVPEGQHFIGWTVKVGDEEQKADTFLTPDKNDPTKATFTMPSKNVEVTANFASNPTLNPTLRVGDHVTATIDGSDTPVPSGSAVLKNTIVHLTAIAPDGQHFTGWTVKVGSEEQKADTFLKTPDASDPTKVTFTMPNADVEVTATFAGDSIPEPDPVGPSDTGNIQGALSAVVIGAAAGAIIYEAGTGIYRVINMPGIPMPSNRIELAELLWEHAGKPEPVSTALYSDIDEGDTDAQKAARWAVEQDLMKDDADNNKFHPAFPVSKLRTCLTWNAAKEKGLFDKTEE